MTGAGRPHRLRRALVVTVVGAIIVAAVLIVRDSGDQPRDGVAPRAQATVPPTGIPHEPNRTLPMRRTAQERAALTAARRFLVGYLPYSYGRGRAAAITSAAGPLSEELRRAPPRVPRQDRRLDPRVQDLEVATSNGDLGFDVTAVITDGRRAYSLVVAVRPVGDRWLVTALS